MDLDFGFAWDGTLLHLEIKVQPAGGGGFTTLSPRQPMYSVPAALYAADADTLDGMDSSAFLVSGGTVAGGLDFNETFTTTDSSVVGITFGNGVGSILGAGLEINAGPLQPSSTSPGAASTARSSNWPERSGNPSATGAITS